MALSAGTRLGPYEIQSALGAGGMGEVFRARDSRLGREVAIKVVPELFADDPDRLARFAREAQMLASLNHPNIAAIYGLEESGSVKALVLELVEGPTLADRLVHGPLPLEETLPIARQIADALEAAHEKGIIHRDLKPANIKLRPDGTVKVLDFGLAKALEPNAPANAETMNSPTLTARATRMGIILGTAAYMSPGQAKGKAVDKRADIWAFGCVLYEMLTGRRAFEGEDISDTLAFVITKEPDWTAVPANVPGSIRRLLRRCLEKDRKRRLADIADARLELNEALTPSVDPGATSGVSHAGVPVGWRRSLPWMIAAGMGVAFVALLLAWAPWRPAAPTAPFRLSADLGAGSPLVAGVGFPSAFDLSPDGNVLAFTAQKAGGGAPVVYLRRFDQLSASPIAGTEGAAGPFFSPDGRWVGFFADRKLKKIPTTGGTAVSLADAPSPRGASWAEDGTIVFTPDRQDTSLVRVADSGGRPELLISLAEGEAVQRWPQVLLGGKAVLYTSHVATSGFDAADLVVQPLPAGARKTVVRGGYHGRYLPSGHLIYVREGTLYALPFDLERLEPVGSPVPAVEGVSTGTLSGGTQFAVSQHGTLVYVSGRASTRDIPIFWIGREGKQTLMRSASSYFENFAFSPEGRRVAMDLYDGRQWDIWVYEWERDRLSRLTFEGNELGPVWTPDGRRIAFVSRRGDIRTSTLYWQRADGTGEMQRLLDSASPLRAGSWHPSGRFLAYSEHNSRTDWDLMILPVDGDEAAGWTSGKPRLFLGTPFAEAEPMFSPDGRWLAYQSSETGQSEVYVRPFPGPGGKSQVSAGGGTNPVWSPTRQELFYISNGQMMVASYSVVAGTLVAEKPRASAKGPFARGAGPRLGRRWDLHPDGERFAVGGLLEMDTASLPDRATFIFNFFDELRRIAPAAKR